MFQVRERLRVALERNTALEEELTLTKEEVSLYFEFVKIPPLEALLKSIN